jgi:carboxynorspermidine decarboxylase
MIDFSQIKRSAYVLDEKLLRKNLEIIQRVQQEAGVEIILAFKGFAMWSTFPLLREYIKGATASSLHEARLCYEEMKSKAHTYSAAYNPDEFEEMMSYSQHITFNSVSQYFRYKEKVHSYSEEISCGIRVNPEYSEVETALYNPCAPGSRLGATRENFPDGLPEGVEGLHFHALCESSSYELEKVLLSFEQIFGDFIPQIKWLNVGGGHLMTRKDYDVTHLIQVLKNFKVKHPHLEIIMEPGSAFAWQTGVLVSNVLDIVENKSIKTLMLDVSFTAHMPDCLEMPYRPKITGASDEIADRPTYRIGGTSCLSGDYMENYSFEKEVQIGDQVIFEDMIHYTLVKTTMFNGVRHPDICIWREDNTLDIVKRFEYEDYRNRMS